MPRTKDIRLTRFVAVLAATAGLAVLGWREFQSEKPAPRDQVAVQAQPQDPLRIVLTPLDGDSALDRQFRELQRKVEEGTNRNAFLERLGWAFVAKARLSSDPGFYTLAEQAAKAIASRLRMILRRSSFSGTFMMRSIALPKQRRLREVSLPSGSLFSITRFSVTH